MKPSGRGPAGARHDAVAVRESRASDREAVLAMVRAAFTKPGHDGRAEADIVEATWAVAAPADAFELVAHRDGVLVGHVLAATGRLGAQPVLGIAPLSVAPGHQHAGIGIALMTDLLDAIASAGHPLVVLLGSPAYYARFGFEPAWPLGITYRPAGVENPHFMAHRLATYDPSMTGEFTYCWESQGIRSRSPGPRRAKEG